MQLLQFKLWGALLGFYCLLFNNNCCEGRPSLVSSSSLAANGKQYFTDCGAFRRFTEQSGSTPSMSLVSSLLRSKFFPSTYQPTFTCWRASNVEEVHTSSKSTSNSVMRTTIQFNVEASSLENIKSAVLTMVLAYPENTMKENHKQFGNLQAKGTESGLNATQRQIPLMVDDKSTIHRKELKFDALALLMNAFEGHKEASAVENPLDYENVGVDPEIITVKFFVTYTCNNMSIEDCPRLIDTEFHTPSLSVFYI